MYATEFIARGLGKEVELNYRITPWEPAWTQQWALCVDTSIISNLLYKHIR